MQEFRAVASALGSNWVAAGTLSLAPQAYVGRFVEPHWGTLILSLRAEELRASIGELSLRLHAAGREAFQAVNGQTELQGSFVLDGERVVSI